MSGKKRSEVVEALAQVVKTMTEARDVMLARSHRFHAGMIGRAERELAALGVALAEAGTALRPHAAAPGAAAVAERLRRLEAAYPAWAHRLAAARTAHGAAADRLREIAAELDRAAALEAQTRRSLEAEDAKMCELELPPEWFRDAEYCDAVQAAAAAGYARQLLERSEAEHRDVVRQVDEVGQALTPALAEALLLVQSARNTARQLDEQELLMVRQRAEAERLAAELAAATAEIPADFAAWAPLDALELPDVLQTLARRLAECRAAATWTGFVELGREIRRQLANLARALPEVEENRRCRERQERIAHAIMATLTEMNFDVSFAPGTRDEPFRISGQTPRSDGDGDFDIAIPRSGALALEVVETRGDGRDCRLAVDALRAELNRRFGLYCVITDWGHATAASPPDRAAEPERGLEKTRQRHAATGREVTP